MRAVWKIKSVVVEAEQLTASNVPEGVEVDANLRGGGNVYTVRTMFGRLVLPLGTWMVYDAEGARPVPQAIFERLYEPLSIGGRVVAAGGRAIKKIIGADS